MPNMIEERRAHKSVAINNKLFVVGGSPRSTCEVFDSTCDNFVLLKQPPVSFRRHLVSPTAVISIGSKLAVFDNQIEDLLFYHVENDEWSEESYDVTKSICLFSCVKVAQM